MRYRLNSQQHTEAFTTAVRRFELGLYDYAHTVFTQIVVAEPNNLDARYFCELARRRLMPKPAARTTLVWQFDPAGAWERDWLRYLLGDTIANEVVDNTWSRVIDPMIVVDNRLVPEKTPYYRAAFEQGARIVLVHLSDEAFREDTSAYRYCDAVIRNYHSEILAEQRGIFFFPLGCKAGFVRGATSPQPAAARKHLWSFAGDAKKLTRARMLEAMQALPGGVWHLTAGFGTPDNLSTDAYRAMLDDTVIVPCPSGWANLETFRVYEALEAGCIPIVERRPGFDYFTDLLGPHPIPTVLDWSETPGLVNRWQADGRIETLRQACWAWWEAYKPRLAAALREHLRQPN